MNKLPRYRKPIDRANIAIVLAALCLAAWLLPVVGIPLSIIALTFAAKALPTTRAIVALVIAVLALGASGVNSYIGAMQGYQREQQVRQQSQQAEKSNEARLESEYDEWGYPADFGANFTTSCMIKGGTSEACSCSLGVIQEMYAYPQVQGFEESGSYPPEYLMRVRQSCA